MAILRGVLLAIFAWGAATVAIAEPPGQAADSAEVDSLRSAGPEGLQKALASLDELQAKRSKLEQTLIELSRSEPGTAGAHYKQFEQEAGALDSQITKLQTTIDAIGSQRGCSVSRLYWYTDLNEAKAEAARTGRPILSLRMLGKLTDEYSCANSRFFRTALYSNKKISDYLRDNYVLHWQSVRPVPKVTIDFGDGRKLERTLTGNGAHYALASDGTPLDVLPGLYSPQAFLNWLAEMDSLNGRYQNALQMRHPTFATATLLREYHANQLTLSLDAWDRDLQRLGEARTRLVSARIDAATQAAALANTSTNQDGATSQQAPPAAKAATRAVGKGLAEKPMLRFANLGGATMERGMDDELWQAVADLHREETKLDDASVAMMSREFPRAAVAGRLAGSKWQQENPVLRVVRTFEGSMTLDTVRNEYLLHRRVHERFIDGRDPTADVDALNEWVYAELFLTPSRDPWLGLAPNDVYTALENDGRTEPVTTSTLAKRPGG